MTSQSIYEFVAQELAAGRDEATIREQAAKRGWAPEDINGALARARLGTLPAPVIATSDGSTHWVLVALVLMVAAGGLVVYRYHGSLSEASAAVFDQFKTNEYTIATAPFIPFNPVPVIEEAQQAVRTVSRTATRSHTPSVAYTPPTYTPPTNQQPTRNEPHTPAPEISIHASSSVVPSGTPVTLTWKIANATACRSSSGFSMHDPVSGSTEVRPLLSTSYTITCTGPGGTEKDTVYVRTTSPNDTTNTTPNSPVDTSGNTPDPADTTNEGPDPTPPPVPETPPATTTPPAGPVVVAADTSAIAAALKAAKGGEVITVPAGDYGALSVKNISYSSPVTLRSADPSHPASFTTLFFSGVENLVVQNFEINVPSNTNGVTVTGKGNVTIDRLKLHNGVNNGIIEATDGNGILVRNTSHVTVSNSTFYELNNGIGQLDNTYLTLTGNTFSRLWQDAIRGGGSSNVTITRNFFTNFNRGQGVHADAIQFWTSNTTEPTHDFYIAENVFLRGDGSGAQGVFMGNERHLPFSNVVIRNNVIIGGFPNGIAVGYGKNVTIDNNVVVGYTDMASKIRLDYSQDVTLTRNYTTHYVFIGTPTTTYTLDQSIDSQGKTGIAPIPLGDLTATMQLVSQHGLTSVTNRSLSAAILPSANLAAAGAAPASPLLSDFLAALWETAKEIVGLSDR